MAISFLSHTKTSTISVELLNSSPWKNVQFYRLILGRWAVWAVPVDFQTVPVDFQKVPVDFYKVVNSTATLLPLPHARLVALAETVFPHISAPP